MYNIEYVNKCLNFYDKDGKLIAFLKDPSKKIINSLKMKKLITINSHSFVDVITNSSTELFVCDIHKTVEMIKEILENILEGYNDMSDSSYTMDVFGDIFLFKYDEFRKWKECDKKKRAECERSGDWSNYHRENYNGMFNTIDSWFTDHEDEDKLNNYRKRIIEEGPSSGNIWSSNQPNPYKSRLDKAQGEKWDWDKRKKEVNKIFEELVNSEEKPKWWNSPWESQSYCETLVESLDNKIIIIGSEGNSIPYDIWDHINSQLCATNYHLG